MNYIPKHWSTPPLDCDPTILGSLVSSSDATCRREESSLQTEHGSVCYTGRMRGALAYYTCDTGHQLAVASHGSSVTQVRVCRENGRWNGTAPVCVPLEGISCKCNISVKNILNLCGHRKQRPTILKFHLIGLTMFKHSYVVGGRDGLASFITCKKLGGDLQ